MKSPAFLLNLLALVLQALASSKTCTISPLGQGKDDTTQVLAAIDKCGKSGTTILKEGNYNITRKMTWNLENAHVDLHGTLNFVPDIQYWLNASNTYRVVFIQDQASWFVVTGKDFTIDAHETGGIEGNGQPWWEYFQSHVREDGDGRPLSLTVFEAVNGNILNFHIHSPPFWCNAVANSFNVLYDGMNCNATNTNPAFFGQKSDSITLRNWDVTCGDDCLAVKGNSSNILVQNWTCRGGNGMAIGSLGQYYQFPDQVSNVLIEDATFLRLNSSIQPNMASGVYLKTWTGTVNGAPPTGGGGGSGFVKQLTARNMKLDRVSIPVQLFQTNSGKSTDAPSTLQISDLHFENWSGTAATDEVVDLECSPAVPCPGITFSNFKIETPNNTAPEYICKNVVGEHGLNGPCNTTGHA